MIAHWDEAESGRAEAGHIAGEWTDLGMAAGTKTVGVCRVKVDPGKWSTPLHRQTAEEETFFVLGGSGICLLRDSAFEVGPGDCIVHRVRREAAAGEPEVPEIGARPASVVHVDDVEAPERWSSGPRRSGPGAASPTRRSRSERATSSRARPRAGSPRASAQARTA